MLELNTSTYAFSERDIAVKKSGPVLRIIFLIFARFREDSCPIIFYFQTVFLLLISTGN